MLPTSFAIFVVVAAWCSTAESIVRIFLLCCLFGATAAFTLPSLGNAPVTPAVAMVPVLLWRALTCPDKGSIFRHAAPGTAGFWLSGLLLWGLLSALLLPRLFAGQTTVYSTSRSELIFGMNHIPLAPGTTNLTQAAYLIVGVGVFLSVSLLLENKGRARQFATAVIALSVANIATALIGIAEYAMNITGPVGLVKNAGYALLDGQEVFGLVRITGMFPETSAFASFTLPLLAFCTSLWRAGFRVRFTGGLALAQLILLCLSTSSTAYGSLVVYASFLLLISLLRLSAPHNAVAFGWCTVLVGATTSCICVIALLKFQWLLSIWEFLNVLVFQKLGSSSGVERSSWNYQAWVNTIETYGAGAGLGSVRASSFPLVLLSNVGLLGTALFLAFILRCTLYCKGETSGDEGVATIASRHALLAALISASFSATVFDLGMAFYAFAAAAAMPAISRPASRHISGGKLNAAK